MLDKHIKSDIRYKKDPFMVVSVNDSAIDKDSNIIEYQKTRDMSHLKLNGAATIFHLKLLPSSAFATLTETAAKFGNGQSINHSILYKFFLSACLIKVENVCAVDEFGNARDIANAEPRKIKVGNSLEYCEDKFWDEYFPNCPTTLEEIGKVAFERHFLAEGIWSQFGR